MYKPTMFCASPNCSNKCGRKIPSAVNSRAARYESHQLAFFCDRTGEPLLFDGRDNVYEKASMQPKADK